MSKSNEVASMAENIAAQVAAETENTETDAKVETVETPTQEAAPAKGKKGKKANAARADFEDAQIEALERQREIEAKQKELAECLKVLEHKKKLSANRTKFIDTLDQLEEAQSLINPDDFETKRMRLTLEEVSDNGYRNNGFSTSISNSNLILEFIAMLKNKITAKIEELETELVK